MPANIITRKAGYPQIPKCHRILYYLETVFHSLSNFRGKTFETKQIGFLHCRTQSQPNCLFSKKQDALLSKLIIFFFFLSFSHGKDYLSAPKIRIWETNIKSFLFFYQYILQKNNTWNVFDSLHWHLQCSLIFKIRDLLSQTFEPTFKYFSNLKKKKS